MPQELPYKKKMAESNPDKSYIKRVVKSYINRVVGEINFKFISTLVIFTTILR